MTEVKEILNMWKGTVAMLHMEHDASGDDQPFDMLLKVAEFAGIQVDISGQVPKNPAIQRLFFEAASESLTNAVSHANAKMLRIRLTEPPNTYSIRFTNDGALPSGSIIEGGGLSSLRKKSELLGGYMDITTTPEFSLTLTIPRKAGENACTTF